MNWTQFIVGGLVGTFITNIFWGIQQMHEISLDNDYFCGMVDGTKNNRSIDKDHQTA